ncbi:MAG: M48 family metalloprotease [Desulforhopalus sp.]|nr:M48 family metalloprotease [Desulforhopalus sp.]
MYTNLLLFLVAIFLFTLESVPQTPWLGGWQALVLFVALIVGYRQVARRLFARQAAFRSAGYFRTEKQLSILALVFFGVTLYTCDPKYYLSILPLGKTMPALVNLAGLLLFIGYLSLMWRAGQRNYEYVFGEKYRPLAFIRLNIQVNLPIVLPWIIISLLYDVVALIPVPGLEEFAASKWGDLLLFGVFLIVVTLFFPPLVRRLWGCRPLPEGPLKDHLRAFCAIQNFSADFYLWPLFEGRVLTAGVMGIVPGLRYILITPALIETMSLKELEAVVAHEVGHVKKYHLLLYVFLLAGFSVLAGMLVEPFIYLLLAQDMVNAMILASGIDAESVLTVVGSVPLVVFLLFYFRFVFGYFVRNFERQADLYSLAAIGHGRDLISAFEKIALLSGTVRDEHNWHHFGIGERIECLVQAERQPELIKRHDRKVRFGLISYVAVVVLAGVLVGQIPKEQLASRYQENFAETILLQKATKEPDRALWQRLIGDLMMTKKMEEKARTAYEKAYSLEPVNPEIMNNLAWLLLTSEDLRLRDPLRALSLARAAASLQARGHIYDTLATAYWANGLVEEAVHAERQAAAIDPAQRRFYQAQIARFLKQTYEESLKELEAKQQARP